jgi:hypothetical protein
LSPSPLFPEALKELNFSRHPGENQGEKIANALKTSDSGFRRNHLKKDQIDFFTTSLFQRGKK